MTQTHSDSNTPTDIATLRGLTELWSRTMGDPSVTIAVLDGPADLTHPSLRGADLTQLDHLSNVAHSSLPKSDHGTHVTSIIFGQHDSEVRGIAPACRGLIIPIFRYSEAGELLPASQESLAKAIRAAVRFGAQVINISGGQISPTGQSSGVLTDAVLEAADHALLVAAAGNDGCNCLHVPGAMPGVIAVGAMGQDGEPLAFSNWGDAYQQNGILAPGQRILGASRNGGAQAYTGTSFSAPILSGVAGLLLSLQSRPTVAAVRQSLLTTDEPDCNLGSSSQEAAQNCQKQLAGRLNVQKSLTTVEALAGGAAKRTLPSIVGPPPPNPADDKTAGLPARDTTLETTSSDTITTSDATMNHEPVSNPTTTVEEQVTPSSCSCGCGGSCGCGSGKAFAYPIGELDYTFVSHARRDSIAEAMDPIHAQPGYRPVPERPIDLLRHLCGFREVEVTVNSGQIAKVEPRPGSAFYHLQITRSGGGPFIKADHYRRLVITGMLERPANSGAPLTLSPINTRDMRIRYFSNADTIYTAETSYDTSVIELNADDARWHIARHCEVKETHRPAKHDACGIIWKVMRGQTDLYALQPAGSFSEAGYEELIDFLLSKHGLKRESLDYYYFSEGGVTRPWFDAANYHPAFAWDPAFNHPNCCNAIELNDPDFNKLEKELRKCCDNYQAESIKVQARELTAETRKSTRISAPGNVTGSTRVMNGNTLSIIDPEIRGTLAWSTEALVELLLSALTRKLPTPPSLTLRNRLREKFTELSARLEEEARNPGLTSHDRALNFSTVQLQNYLVSDGFDLFVDIAKHDVTPLELEAFSVNRSDNCRPNSDCWDVEFAFFNPDNTNQASHIVRKSIDVSDVVPVLVDKTNRFRRRFGG